MDREQATQALGLLRRAVAEARDDTALQNWGLIWLGNACSNSAGFVATHVLLQRGEFSPWPYVALWTGVMVVNGATIGLLKQKRAGSQSFIDKQIWNIWNTFIVGMALVAVVNLLLGLRVLFAPAVGCVLVASAFSAMGAVMGKWWYAPAFVWAGMALVLAALPELQFALFAGLWLATQGTGGFLLHRARLRRLASPKPVARLV